jgi:hypothetical protein
VEMNDAFAVWYDCTDGSVEMNDEGNDVFALLGVSSCGSIRSVFALSDVSSGKSVKTSKMPDVFRLPNDASDESVEKRDSDSSASDSSVR